VHDLVIVTQTAPWPPYSPTCKPWGSHLKDGLWLQHQFSHSNETAMWICFHGYGARELYLVFAHNNSYEIKLAVAVTPTISSAPSTRFQQHKWMRWFTCICLPEPHFYSLTKHVNTNQKIDQFQIMPHTVSRTERTSKVWTPITGAGGIHQCSQEHTMSKCQVFVLWLWQLGLFHVA
jgi:hypothetical protein